MYEEQDIIDAINNDDYAMLRSIADDTTDDEEAAELRRAAQVAYNNVWSYDRARDMQV